MSRMKFKKVSGWNAVFVTVRRKVTYVLQQNGLQPFLESLWNSERMACYLSIQWWSQLTMLKEKMGLNCHIRYSPYNLARKKKSLRSRNKKAELGQSSAFLRSSMGSNSRGSSSSKSYLYCMRWTWCRWERSCCWGISCV